MSLLDWAVMTGVTLFIALYGVWKSRGAQSMRGYLLSDNEMKWWSVGLSIMATQASAITFLSTPGQAFDDGMRFVQFYFGVPIAMVVIAVVAIPQYRRLNVFTAYEYLEQRFDLKTRSLTALLFLLSRGMGAGMTIYAPSIILSGLLGWSIDLTCIGTGLVVMGYTALGGNRAVSQTQQQQMFIILLGMVIAGVAMVMGLPEDISYGEAVFIAGSMGKLNAITTDINLADRYNLFSGLIGGTFLALSYFGTDQSQVQRYLGGRSISESRTGLMFNAMLKVPMQFGILFIGALMYVFYQFAPQPLIFNASEADKLRNSAQAEAFARLEAQHQQIAGEKSQLYRQLLDARAEEAPLQPLRQSLRSQDSLQRQLKRDALQMMKANDPKADTNDLDRVFLNFVLNHLPPGLVGLLIAVILAASMSSSSAELSALSATTVVDVYRRNLAPGRADAHYVAASRWVTLAWGLIAIGFALFARSLGNLIQAVNIIGSLFYGTILGVFAVAFFFRRVGGSAVFWAAALTELMVAASFYLPARFPASFGWLSIGYLWLNLAGCAMVILLSNIFQALWFQPRKAAS